MNINTLWSLRLGFSAKQSSMIQDMGLEQFLSNSFNTRPSRSEPSFLQKTPKTIVITRLDRVIHRPDDGDIANRAKLIKRYCNVVGREAGSNAVRKV